MTSYGSPDFNTPEEDPLASPGRARKKLQLKPRSNRNVQIDHEPPLSPRSSKSNPFGSALPREQVLAQRGVDVKSFDAKFEQKAKVSTFSNGQEEQIEKVRQELTHLEGLWRDANEKELPEEEFRVRAEAKREELKQLMNRFSSGTNQAGGKNDDTNDGGGGSFTPVTTRRTSKHRLPPREKPAGDAISGMSRHRFGTAMD